MDITIKLFVYRKRIAKRSQRFKIFPKKYLVARIKRYILRNFNIFILTLFHYFVSPRTWGNIPHRPGEHFRIFCSSGVLICKYQKSSCRAALYGKLRKISFLNFVHCRSTDRFYSFSFFSYRIRNIPKYLFLTVYILSFPSAPPYNTFLPHTEQVISPLITFAPQCLQYLASSSSGAQFTHISISGLYTIESTHLPHKWHKLKFFLPSASHAAESSASKSSA